VDHAKASVSRKETSRSSRESKAEKQEELLGYTYFSRLCYIILDTYLADILHDTIESDAVLLTRRNDFVGCHASTCSLAISEVPSWALS
jgi:hypothetical protein